MRQSSDSPAISLTDCSGEILPDDECLEHQHERLGNLDGPCALRVVGDESDVGVAILDRVYDVLRCLDADKVNCPSPRRRASSRASSTAGPPTAPVTKYFSVIAGFPARNAARRTGNRREAVCAVASKPVMTSAARAHSESAARGLLKEEVPS